MTIIGRITRILLPLFTLQLTLAFLLPPLQAQAAASFKDVKSTDPYAGYIHFLAAEGITTGMGDGTFGAELTLTRAEFATFLVKAFDIPSSDQPSPFTDTDKHWAAGSINAAFAAGIINGITPTAFSPNQEVKRQEAAAVLWRYLQAQSLESREQQLHPEDLPDSWAAEAVQNMASYGMHGPGEVKFFPEGAQYRPKDDMLRKEMAALLVTAMTELKLKRDSAATGEIIVKNNWGTHMEPQIPQKNGVIHIFENGQPKPVVTVRIVDVLNPGQEGFHMKREDGVFMLANIPVLLMESDTLGKEQMDGLTKDSNAASEIFAKLEFVADEADKSYTVKLPEAEGFIWKRYDPFTGKVGIVSGEEKIYPGSELYLDAGSSPDRVNYMIMFAVFQGDREDGLPDVQRIQAYGVN